MRLNSSPARWLVEPLPAEPIRSSPRLARASAMNSFTDFAGTEGCTESALKNCETSETCAKSLIGS
jgi:hypothetical protein